MKTYPLFVGDDQGLRDADEVRKFVYTRQLREACGLSRAELGVQIGYSSEMIRAIEAGLRKPSVKLLKSLEFFFKEIAG